MSRRVERALAVFGAATLLVVGFDAVTYAATGSSLILGHANKTSTVTTVQNTGKGAALSLLTKSPASPPFTTNAKGRVVNLNADKVDGLTAAQIQTAARTGVDAASVNGLTAAQIQVGARAGVDAATLNGLSAAQVAARGAQCGGIAHGEVIWTVPGSVPGGGCNFYGAYLDHAFLYLADLTNAYLGGAHLTNANVGQATLVGVDFGDAVLDGSSLTSANLSGARAINAHMIGTNLTSANLTGTNLTAANLTGANLTSANLTGANLTQVNFTNANLTGAITTGANIFGAGWSNTTCPDGSNSNSHFNTCNTFGF